MLSDYVFTYVLEVRQHLPRKESGRVEDVSSHERFQLDSRVFKLDERQPEPPLQSAQGTFQFVRSAHR